MPGLTLINGNTSATITDRLVAEAKRFLGGLATVDGLTARFGSAYISDRAAATVAGHAVLDLGHALKTRAEYPDAVVIACFGDPGLWALRELLPCPVVGMAEASILMASQYGRRFGIVTGGAGWKPMLTEFVDLVGMSSRLAGIEAVSMTGDAVARDPDGAVAPIRQVANCLIKDRGADVVILGGAGLVGMKARLAATGLNVPILCSLECALAQAVAHLVAAQRRSDET